MTYHSSDLFKAVALIWLVAAACFVAYGMAYYAWRWWSRRGTRMRVTEVHVFLDIETLALEHDAPVLVIGAAVFNEFGRPLASHLVRVEVDDAVRHGRKDPATEEWWLGQSEAARHQAFHAQPRHALAPALAGLSAFFKEQCVGGPPPQVWGNAPQFDCVILRHAYGAVGRVPPWEYWQERDCRTVAALGKRMGFDAKADTQFEGEPHNALHDAQHQGRYTMAILEHLRSRG